MHACALADLVGITTVIVPARAGVLSAVGLLASPVQHDLVRSAVEGADVDAALARAGHEAAAAFAATGAVDLVTAVDCRYPGQSHEITVATVADFHAEHARRNGYARPDTPSRWWRCAPRRGSRRRSTSTRCRSTERAAVRGPTVVSEADCTIWVPDGWQGEPGASGALVLTRAELTRA